MYQHTLTGYMTIELKAWPFHQQLETKFVHIGKSKKFEAVRVHVEPEGPFR